MLEKDVVSTQWGLGRAQARGPVPCRSREIGMEIRVAGATQVPERV